MNNLTSSVRERPRRAYCPNGYVLRVVTTLGLVGVSLAIGGCSEVDSRPARNLPAANRVVYVSYVDTPEDGRGRADFERFEREVQLQQARTPVAVKLEFEQVAGEGETPILQLMDKVIRSQPAVIVASSHEVLEAAKARTQTIPVLFMSHADPVELGHVKGIAAPGVNRTGFTFYVPILGKALELLTQAYPHVHFVGIVADPSLLGSSGFLQELSAARSALGLRIDVFKAVNKGELAAALSSQDAAKMDAWYVPMGDLLWSDRDAALALMANTYKPVMYERSAHARQAGTLAYEARVPDPFGLWAAQLMLLLNGVAAGTIPVERPSAFELTVAVERPTSHRRFIPTKAILKRADTTVDVP